MKSLKIEERRFAVVFVATNDAGRVKTAQSLAHRRQPDLPGRPRHDRRFILLGAIVVLAGCATEEYYSFSRSPIIQGRGGAGKRVNGIDLWIMGTPSCKFRIIGYLTDSRPGGPISMAARDGDLAAKVRAAGGDGLIMNSDVSNYVGTFTTANASAYTSGNVSWTGNVGYFNANTNAYGNGMSIPLYQRNSRYFVIKYTN